MGSTLISQEKMMFYPTDVEETYRILGVATNLRSKFYYNYDEAKNLLGKATFDSIYSEYNDLKRKGRIDTYLDFSYYLYDYIIKQGKYDLLDKLFHFTLGFENTSIADLFAGEGEWLRTFTKVDNVAGMKLKTYIANEIEPNRYNEIKKKNFCTLVTNSSFEDLYLPKNSIGLMLYNPPYGDTNGVRNVRWYLEMILERELLYTGMGACKGSIIMVIRQDDAIDILDILTKYFNVSTKHIYKTNEEEFKKFKQIVLYASIRETPIDDKSVRGCIEYRKVYEEYKNAIQNAKYFNLNMYNFYFSLPKIDSQNITEYVRINNNLKYIKSNKSKLWDDIKETTEVKDKSIDKITMARNPKVGELSNLIASGYLNSMLSLNEEDETGKHVVVGGTKYLEDVTETNSRDENGNMVTKTTVVKYTKPYINLLINKNGKLEFKELEV